MKVWKAALAALAAVCLAGTLARAEPRFVPGGAPAGILVRGKPPATIRSPVTGEILYKVPRRLVRAARDGERTLMLVPRAALPRRAREVRVQYSGYGQGGGGGRPPHVLRELGRQGYSDVGGLTRRGSNYVGEATGPHGQRQRIIIDAESGRVRGSSPSGGGRAPSPGGFYGGY